MFWYKELELLLFVKIRLLFIENCVGITIYLFSLSSTFPLSYQFLINSPPIFFNLCVNAPLKTWKSNPRQTIGHSWHENCIYHGGNVFKRMNGAFSHRLLHKQGVKRTISTVNWKNRRWKRNFIEWIEFLGHECLKKLNQKEDNAINEQEIVVKAMFMWWKTFCTPWMQFSWHVLPFHRGENVFNDF